MKKISKSTKAVISVLLILMVLLSAMPTYSYAKAKVKLNKTKATLYVGKTVTLKLKNNKKKIKWSSSNKKVATVSSRGKVKAKKKGNATITAKVGKKKYKCKVTVKVKTKTPTTYVLTPRVTSTPKPTNTPSPTTTPTVKPTNTPKPKLESISLEDIEIQHGKSLIIAVKPYPIDNDTYDKRGYGGPSIIWENSNPDVIQMERDSGCNAFETRLTSLKGVTGTATITARAGDMVATCKVTVPDVEAEFELSEDGKTILGVTNADTATVINIPNTVTTISEEKDGFYYCKYIKTLEIPSSVTTIEKFVFPQKADLESIYIPSSVTFIGSQNISIYTCIIYGEAGSYAEQWAKDRGNQFIAVER